MASFNLIDFALFLDKNPLIRTKYLIIKMSLDGAVAQKLSQLKYSNKQQAKADILNALREYRELRPEQKEYRFENGKSSTLLSLNGTIPVTFMGATYNIPICLYLLNQHPIAAPLVHVVPTSTMVIKQGKHVDHQGRVYHPYLTQWKHPRNDLSGLISILQVIFGEEPPVFSRSPYQPQTQPQTQPAGPRYQTPYPTQPLPGMPGGMTMPGMMPGGFPSSTGYPGSPLPPSSTPYSASGYGTASNPYPGAQPVHTNDGLTGKIPSRQESVLGDETIRMSLLSALDDKLKRRVKEVVQMGQSELEALQKTNQKLEQGKQCLDNVISRLKQEKNVIDENISMLNQKNSDVEQAIKRMEEDAANLNIDEAVVTTAPLYNQIMQLYAEENAIEDALYYLNDGLRRDVIELDVFLKTVRQCSRKQFILRATLQKARKTAGLQ